MKNKFLNTVRSVTAIAAIAIVAVSCKKDASAPEASAPASTKSTITTNAVPNIATYTITGRYGNPGLGPANFGTVYVDLTNGDQDTVATFAGVDVHFTGTNNSVIQVPAGSTLKTLYNPSKTFAALKVTDFTGSAVTSVGRNTANAGITPNGWYNYQAPGGVVPISGFFILVTPPAGSPYAIQVTAAAGQGTATSNRGVYTIRTGVTNNL
jgi:hypothetical protein